jgi:hypothetical protein
MTKSDYKLNKKLFYIKKEVKESSKMQRIMVKRKKRVETTLELNTKRQRGFWFKLNLILNIWPIKYIT